MHWQRTLKNLSHSPFTRHKNKYPELVSEATQRDLRQLAKRPVPGSLDISQEVHQRMLGEGLSPFAKSGFEFAETRLYQAGDNVRFINWRRYASSGELYINTFHEERRPQCWLVMDRRASMRFATRVRLKAAQAAVYTLYYLFKAQHGKLDIGGVVLDGKTSWYEARSSSASLQPLINNIIAPCPPAEDRPDRQLAQALRLLNTRLSPGCIIIVASDFHDLERDDFNTLSALADKHTLAAAHIVDPIESRLPNRGNFSVLDASKKSVITLDCNDRTELLKLNSSLLNRLDDIEQELKQCRVHYKRIFSDEGQQTMKVVL
jgi:uncharacterized protein (DUF58 family)